MRSTAAARLISRFRSKLRPRAIPRPARAPLATAGVLVAAFAIGVFVVLPAWIDWAIAARFARIPGARAQIQHVRVDPFELGVELRGVELVDPDAGVALDADRITANFDLRSLFTRSWSLDALTLERPRLELREPWRNAWRGPGARETAGPALGRLRLDRVLVTDGTVLLHGALPTGGDVSLAGLRFEGRDLGTDARGPGRYQASVRRLTLGDAKVGTLELDGTLASPSLATAGQLRLAGFDLGAFAPWLGPGLAGSGAGTGLRFAAHYRFAASGSGWPAGRLELANGTLEAAVAGRPQPIRVVGIGGSLGAGKTELGGTLAGAGSASLTLELQYPGAELRRAVALGVDGVPGAFLAAFTRRWLGRALEAGRIGVALHYAERGGRVEGSVQVHAEQPAFAPAADGAGTVPIDVALALLRDPGGRVDLAAPLSFNAAAPAPPQERPETLPEALGRALRQRLRVLTAAPLQTLAGLTDLDAAALGAVEFEPGSAAPSAQGQKTLAAWAQVLAQRPALGLAAGPEVDPKADRRALAQQEIELHVTLATAGATFNAEPGPLDFASPRVQDVLEEFAGQRLKPEQRATIASEFDASQVKSDKTQRAAYYKAVYDALVANTDIKPEALARLGRYRAQSIENTLAKLGIAKSRIEPARGASAQAAAAAESGAVAVPVGPRFPASVTGSAPRAAAPQGA